MIRNFVTKELTKSFLKNKFQRVVLNGQISRDPVVADVPQDSVLGPFIFSYLHAKKSLIKHKALC